MGTSHALSCGRFDVVIGLKAWICAQRSQGCTHKCVNNMIGATKWSSWAATWCEVPLKNTELSRARTKASLRLCSKMMFEYNISRVLKQGIRYDVTLCFESHINSRSKLRWCSKMWDLEYFSNSETNACIRHHIILSFEKLDLFSLHVSCCWLKTGFARQRDRGFSLSPL